ncbi:hypothetical protein [Cetobacterium sp. ZWU0022]|uniref:FomA family porin-like outer membrane protein n=1 Tax=Cetobacterium sp. ZWU0022 TaxID=1340502 RepID=UPI000646C9E9|nr:hypothetical protein [Cetobacterium sp. ZWU0022]
MKKLALLLGSLLVVGATASAKEAVVAPVEVSKEVVVVAEPVVEVVTEEAFRPTGYVGLEYKAYGKTEGHGDKDTWNKNGNDRARLQTTFGIQMTENSRFEGRVRDYSNLETGANKSGKDYDTETRLRYFYKHSDVLTSRVQYRHEEDNSQNFEYMLRVNAYENKGGLLSKVVLGPKVYHSMAADNGGAYTNAVGLDIEYAGNLPLGFTWDGTLYLDQNFYNEDVKTSATSTTKKSFDVTWELYVYRSFGLYASETNNVDFNMVAGLDPYKFRQYSRYSSAKKATETVDSDGKVVATTPAISASTTEKNTYEAQLVLDVTATHQFTPSVKLKAGLGAEYRNWDTVNESEAKDWRWQPFAFAGVNVTF